MTMATQSALWLLKRVDYYFAGSVIKLNNPDHIRDPYTTFNTLRERSPVLRSYSNAGWIVTGFEQVSSLLRDRRISSDMRKNTFFFSILKFAMGEKGAALLNNPNMLQRDAPDHTRLRKLVAKGFMHKYVQSLAPTIERLVDELVDTIPADADQFDVIESLAKPLPAIVIAEMMGVPVSERHLFETWSEALIGVSDLTSPIAMRTAGEANLEMQNYIATLAEDKRANPGQDLISQLIEAEEDFDKLSLDELYSTCVLLLVAGHETTTRLIGNCLYLLLKHPKQMKLARSDEYCLMNALEESLRFEPPVQFTIRFVEEPFVLEDRSLKRGQMLMLSIAGANRDPLANENPDQFDIEREKIAHVSFGHGIHLCLGMSLARLEAKIVFQKLFERFESLQFAESEHNWGNNDFVRGLETLTVKQPAVTSLTPLPGVSQPVPVSDHTLRIPGLTHQRYL